MNKIEEIQSKIDQLHIELKIEMNKPKEGWYRYPDMPKYLMYIYEDGSRFGFGTGGEWAVCKGPGVSWPGLERVTDEDVLKAISRSVLDTKYREGVWINSLLDIGDVRLSANKLKIKGDQIWLGGCVIMKAGNWADILPPKFYGYEMVQKGNKVSFGKIVFTKEQLIGYQTQFSKPFPFQNHNIAAVDRSIRSIIFSDALELSMVKLGEIIDYMK